MPPPPEQTRTSMSAQPHETVLAAWVHVSDLHFGHGDAGHQWNQQCVLDELLVDAKELVLDGLVPRPDFIFVTGDIAFSGGARTPVVGEAEYALASLWFRQLQEVLKIPSERVFMVPGNHDVDRRAVVDVRRLLKLVRAGEEPLDDILREPLDLDRLRGRLARYLAFAQGFGPLTGDRFHEGLWWRQRIELAEDVSLRVCGLNTALLSLDDEDQGKLRVGQRQLAELFIPASNGLELALILGHHPTTGRWLADEKELRGHLDRHAALYLFGHLHEADSEQARHGWGSGCLRVAAGAAHAEAASPGAPPVGHGYNFGALVVLGTGDLVVRLWPRRWSTKSPRFVPDVDNTLDRRDYAEHRLPEKYRLHRFSAPRSFLSGKVLGGRYRLIAKSGQGGVGEVWQASDLERGDTVAVKILNPDGAESDAGRRAGFFRGAQAMAGLRHPAIVRVRDPRPDPDNKHGPYDFYVMDFIDAPSLGAAFKGSPRTDVETIEILLAIGEGVAAAHRQRVVHRDLKPSNILRDPKSGRVFIIDFDTAKDLASLTITRSGDGLASTLYASPEVLMSLNPPRGSKAPAVDARADIFSLAVIGIFLRTGRDPSHYYINRMSELVPAIECAPGLRQVLAKGCVHAAADRYASVDDLLVALRRLQVVEDAQVPASEKPVSAPPPIAKHRQTSTPLPSLYGPVFGEASDWAGSLPVAGRGEDVQAAPPVTTETDAPLDPPWPFQTTQGGPGNLVGKYAVSLSEGSIADPVEIDFRRALRLPSWWILVSAAVAIFAFWAVVIIDWGPDSPPVALSLGLIIVEPGLKEQSVRAVVESNLGDVRECHDQLRTRLKGPAYIPLHIVVQPSGIVGSAGLTNGVNERSELTDCVVKKATRWKFPRPSIPHFVGVTIHIKLSPDQSRSS